MRAPLIQRQIKLNEQVISGLHVEYNNLRKVRKMYNEYADSAAAKMSEADREEDWGNSLEWEEQAKANREQAAIYTPYILKFKRKIAKLAAVQKALKEELKCAQSIESWAKEEDAFWLQQAKIAQEGGYVTPDSVDALFVSFPREDA